MLNKKCVFHIPYEIKGKYNSGSVLRPNKMINAFKELGYEVEIIEGFGSERRRKIKNLIKKIKNKEPYDFIYTESSNLPTYLSDIVNGHFGRVLDFKLLKVCKKHHIRIGFFYRDIHWKFPHFKQNKNRLKLLVGELFFRTELVKYKKIIDILYVPSFNMLKYIPVNFTTIEVHELPPGSKEYKEEIMKPIESTLERLKIFYVGGLSNLYNIELLFEAVNHLTFIELVVCCREKEWIETREHYEKLLCNRIKIVHASGNELIKYYNDADILSIFVEPVAYWNIAIPIKLFEYIGYHKPIIAVEETAVGNYIEENKLGWTSEYTYKGIESLFNSIYMDFKQKADKIETIRTNITENHKKNTWVSRAGKVIKELNK